MARIIYVCEKKDCDKRIYEPKLRFCKDHCEHNKVTFDNSGTWYIHLECKECGKLLIEKERLMKIIKENK